MYKFSTAKRTPSFDDYFKKKSNRKTKVTLEGIDDEIAAMTKTAALNTPKPEALPTTGSAIKSGIQSVLSKKYGEIDTKHLFDGISDKDIEDNLETAENTIQTNIDRGMLIKNALPKLPNLRDGLALSYAAANKGNSKAATRAREAAYMEDDPVITDMGIRLLSNEFPKFDNVVPKTNKKTKVVEAVDNPNDKATIVHASDKKEKTEHPTSFFVKELLEENKSNNHQIHGMTDEQKEIYESRKELEEKNVLDKDFWNALNAYGEKKVVPDVKRKANDWIFAPILKFVGKANSGLNNFIDNNEYAKKLANLAFNSRDEYSAGDADENYEHNKTVDLYKTGATSGAFINEQSKLGNIKYGLKDVNYGGCGLIAMFNVMHGVGKPIEFADLIYDKEKSAILKGGFGVYPTGITEYLESNNLEVLTDFVGVDKNYNTSNSDAVIHMYFREDGTAHYVAGISDGNGKFRFYNSDTGSTLPKTWEEYFEETLKANEENPVIYSSAYRIKK